VLRGKKEKLCNQHGHPGAVDKADRSEKEFLEPARGFVNKL
jgi:hypothetical protein